MQMQTVYNVNVVHKLS